MQNLFESLLLSSNGLLVVFLMAIVSISLFNYLRSIKHQSLKDIFLSGKAELIPIKIATILCYVIGMIVFLVMGVKQVLTDGSTLATNWWWALLEILIIIICGYPEKFSGTNYKSLYWTTSIIFAILQLVLTIDFISFLII